MTRRSPSRGFGLAPLKSEGMKIKWDKVFVERDLSEAELQIALRELQRLRRKEEMHKAFVEGMILGDLSRRDEETPPAGPEGDDNRDG